MQFSLCESAIQCTDRAAAARNELCITVYENRADPLQRAVLRHEIPQTHLLDVFSRLFLPFSISPGDQCEQRPPRVAEQGHAARANMAHCIDRIVQPREALTHAAFGSRLADEDRAAIALPIQIRKPLDNVS